MACIGSKLNVKTVIVVKHLHESYDKGFTKKLSGIFKITRHKFSDACIMLL